MMMLLRSMGPEVIVTDEIGRAEDAAAIEEVIHAGVTVVATAHGSSLAELRSRPGLRKLLDEQIFERALVLGWSRGAGTVEPVSYTHLDVYKRQLLHTENSIKVTCPQCGEIVMIDDEDWEDEDLGELFDEVGEQDEPGELEEED